MFRLMRNIHLGLGLVFVMMAMIFAVSSLVIIYRPWLKTGPTDSEREIKLSQIASPREAALELMSAHGLAGELRQIEEKGDKVSLRIVRPGEMANIEYSPASGEGVIKLRRQGALETMVQLHTNHGLWHDYFPAQAWAAINLLTSLGLLLLGASGIYLWFAHHKERVIGGVLLGSSLLFGLITLTLTRMQQ